MLELLVLLAILGILAAAALPSLQDTVVRTGLNSASRTFVSALSLARDEAIKRGMNVNICPTDDGTDCKAGSWAGGWIVFVDANGDADGDTGSIDVGDTIVRVFEPLSSLNMTFSPATDLLVYDSRGYGANSSLLTLKLCPANTNDHARAVEISLSGRARSIEEGVTCP